MDTIVSISRFFEKYKSVMPDYLMQLITINTLQGKSKITVSHLIIEMLDEKLAVYKAKKKVMTLCAKRNTKGSEYEKDGKISMAIKTYEANIAEGCYPAAHAFERLMIIYRKQKQYSEEIRVIDRAIEVLCPRYPDLLEKYKTRRSKAEALMSKTAKS